jgi:hypothetical protein
VIDIERFIASSQTRELWLAARDRGVTATQVAKASTPAGMKEVLAQIENPTPVEANAYMTWGTEREAHIAHVVKERYGIMPNDWLLCADGAGNEWMLATPDGLDWHNDHKVIGEYKTSGKPLDKVPANYMRQVMWQLMVSGAEKCLFAYELRLEGPEGFVPGFDVECQWIERNEEMISELILTAQKVQEHAVYYDRAQREKGN